MTRTVLCVALLALVQAASETPPTVAVDARSIRPGEALMVTIGAPGSEPPVVRAFDREWPVYAAEPGRWQALVGIDLDTKPGRYPLTVTASSGRAERPLDVVRRVFPTRRLTVDPNLVNPPPEARERIERETREFAEIWRASAIDRLWTGAFALPVPDPANSAFGTRSVYNGEARSPHSGADFLSPAGRPIAAPAAGRIVLAASRYFTGNTIVIDHGMGLFSLFAHLSVMDVHAGDRVAAGDVVGKVGATGRVTGPHLHWAVRLNGARVDPLSLIDATRSAAGRPEHERHPRRSSRTHVNGL